jgi:cyanophycin synthetase
MLEVDLDLTDTGSADRVERALGHLGSRLPEMKRAAAGGSPGRSLAWGFGRLTLTLQRLAGSPVEVEVVRPERPGVFRVATEFEEETLGVACLEAARRLCLAALRGDDPGVEREMASLRDLALDVRLGPSTAAIIGAARRQGIPALRLNDGNLVQLGHGACQRRIWTAETDRTGAIAEVVAQDKELTRSLLPGAGVPVPEGRSAQDPDDAWVAAEEIGLPVVVKPRHGNHGRGVTTNLHTREQVDRAFAAAREHGDNIVVERYVPGSDFRMLVIGGHLVAAALRQPPQVFGDGHSTVTELVATLNRDPRRSDGHGTSLSIVKLDAIALATLAEQGHTPESVPAEGECVIIRRNANLSSGGTATDMTDRVHPRTAASIVAAVRAVGLDIAGVDVVAPTIEEPLQQSGGAVIEVNAGPGLRMHLDPSAGVPRPVGEAVIRMLYPEGGSGRIPLAAVMGIGDRTARLLAHLLTGAGHLVGMAGTGGLHVGGRQIDSRDCSDPWGARAVLLNPRVTAAVLEVDPAGILREGLGFDRCDVAVVGRGFRPGSESPEEPARLARALVGAISPSGTVVLDGDDPLAVDLAASCPGTVVYFARTENETVAAHLASGGRAVLALEGRLILALGSTKAVLVLLDDLRWMNAEQDDSGVEATLASAAVAWALSLPVKTIRAGLGSFAVAG